MDLSNYPAQEPFSDAARAYHEEVLRRGSRVAGDEVRYGADQYQSILISRPTSPNGAFLAFFHGGGWTNGYKEWMAFMAPSFTSVGITFASIGYRLAPDYAFPVGFRDACAGVKWIAQRAATFDVDPERIFVGGHSAGGHYAALMALTDLSDIVRGCLPISGVYDFGPHSGLTLRPRFLGPADSGSEDAASPMLHIGADPCPFLIAHGSEDFPHLMMQAERMEQALAAKNADVQRIVLPGCNHFSASYAGGDPEGPCVRQAIRWIEDH
jgi:arylformamidase